MLDCQTRSQIDTQVRVLTRLSQSVARRLSLNSDSGMLYHSRAVATTKIEKC